MKESTSAGGKASQWWKSTRVKEVAIVSLLSVLYYLYTCQLATSPDEYILPVKPHTLLIHLHHSKKSDQERSLTQTTIMFSSNVIATLASDVLVLGAGVSIVAIVLGYVSYHNRESLPASINAIIGEIKSHTGTDDDLQELP